MLLNNYGIIITDDDKFRLAKPIGTVFERANYGVRLNLSKKY